MGVDNYYYDDEEDDSDSDSSSSIPTPAMRIPVTADRMTAATAAIPVTTAETAVTAKTIRATAAIPVATAETAATARRIRKHKAELFGTN